MAIQSGETCILLSLSLPPVEPCQNNTGASSQPFVEPSCFGCLPKKIQGDARGARSVPFLPIVPHANPEMEFRPREREKRTRQDES